MSEMKKPTEAEIVRVTDWASVRVEENHSDFLGFSYEEGVRDTLAWLRGEGLAPDDDGLVRRADGTDEAGDGAQVDEAAGE